MLHSLTTLLFPEKPQEAQSLEVLPDLIPLHLGKDRLHDQGSMYLDGLTAAAAYASSREVQDMIRRFKYGRRRSLAPVLGQLMVNTLPYFPLNAGTVLCPVPLHWSRRFSRGFNQAALLAEHVAQVTQIPVVDLLRRTRPTGHQAWRSHDERRLAMHDAFRAQGCDGVLHVTLVDDVATTLSTLDACARVIKEAGVPFVDAIVVALG